MDIERELARLEAWVRDLMPAALAGDAQAAFPVLDILDEMAILLGFDCEGREERPGQ